MDQSYTIRQYETIYKAVRLAGTGMILLCGGSTLIIFGNRFGWFHLGLFKDASILIGLLFIILTGLGIYLLLGIYVWKMEVNQKDISFTNSLGIKKHFTFDDISYGQFEYEGGYTNLILKSKKDHKLVKVEGHCGSGLVRLIEDCKKYHIKIKQ